MKKKYRIIIVTGLSGAGKTIALNTLEDVGFYCIDNLPISLLTDFVGQLVSGSVITNGEIGIGIDARNPANKIASLSGIITRLKKNDDLNIEVVFIEAIEDTLIKRFSETRRKHPLSTKKISLANAIKKERKVMEELYSSADIHIDTSYTLLHQLRDIVKKRIVDRPSATLSLQITSFGYKHGIPKDSDFVFDMRSLPNPHWKKNLRSLNGKDKSVIRFLEKQKDVSTMLKHICTFMDYWIPRFEADNRSYLSIALGCTGGHHRSVYMGERLAEHFRNRGNHVITIHRDIQNKQ